MKYAATILMSFLLLGVCSARILPATKLRLTDDMQQRDTDYWKPAQDYTRENGQYKVEDQKSQQMVQLKEALYKKLRNAYQQLNGRTMSNYLYIFDETMNLTDPLTVGSTVDRHGTLVLHYDNLKFIGLNSSAPATLIVDMDSKMAYLRVSMRRAEIRGLYDASDNNSGAFSMKMSGHLTYITKFPYQIVDGSVQLVNSSGEMYYNSYTSNYEGVGNYPADAEKDLQENFWLLVNEKVHQEMFAKFGDTIKYLILNPVTVEEVPEYSVDKVMQKGIDNAINGIQQVVSKHGAFSIDLASDNKEMLYNKLSAKIASVRLNGIEKFYSASNRISKELADRIHSKVELVVDRPIATAVFSIHETDNEDAPFQKIAVDFQLEKLMANLSLDKSSRQSELEVRSVQAKVDRIWPVGTEKFQGQVSRLIEEKLTDCVKHCVEEGLKNFIQDGLRNVMQRGVSTPSRETRFERIHF